MQQAFGWLAILLACLAPAMADPVAYAVGAFVPWIVLQIVRTPTMPAALVYFLLWQWLQAFARVLVSATDSEPMAQGAFGPWVVNAYWYSMASIVTLAVSMRVVLGSLRPPGPRDATHHLTWPPGELFRFYLMMLLVAAVARQLQDGFGILHQPMETLARIKMVALFLLFAGVLSTQRGYGYLAAVLVFEVVVGFTGILGDFRAVFVVLFIAALASRIRLTIPMRAIVFAAAASLLGLALFWTAIKQDFRSYVTDGFIRGQVITQPFEDRMAYLGGRLIALDEIDWRDAAYQLLNRLAYIDIFGSVIGIKTAAPGQTDARQWSDALAHVFQPRFLFPDKPELRDTEVYVRLAGGDPLEALRDDTSISVGYMAESYADFGFPGMLAGIFLFGAIVSLLCRYFMTAPLPWAVREATVTAMVFAVINNGVETSLAKALGALYLTFVMFALMVRFAYPYGLRWLDHRAALARRREAERRVARAGAEPRS